jgi:hypothetical protein
MFNALQDFSLDRRLLLAALNQLNFMGIVKNNNFTRGISGAVSHDMVFRKYKKKTSVYIKTERESELTDKEKAQRSKFVEATVYGKSIKDNPALEAEYKAWADERDLPNAYAAAVSDFLKGPEISFIDTGKYNGAVGDKIVIKATDNFKVASVEVIITKQDGSIVETGDAVLASNKLTWEYTVTVAHPIAQGDTVTVIASDLPGNNTILEQAI